MKIKDEGLPGPGIYSPRKIRLLKGDVSDSGRYLG